MLLKEAIADAKARRRTELAWCKCVEDCLCEHFKPSEKENYCQSCQGARAPLLIQIAKLTDETIKLGSMVSPFTTV
jgi:hypothetical protein